MQTNAAVGNATDEKLMYGRGPKKPWESQVKSGGHEMQNVAM